MLMLQLIAMSLWVVGVGYLVDRLSMSALSNFKVTFGTMRFVEGMLATGMSFIWLGGFKVVMGI